ncbi:MAG: DUF4167 domain-containing protein [Paracoccaceae bacterium]
MRSSKKRSRSSQNRPRTLGNIINRVFDSSGPEGKVRGTPQQIIEKYQQLFRDAQLSNDRVAAENFQQHAEHYTRMLAEAQREMAAEQEARQAQFQQQSSTGGGNGNGGGGQREYRDRDDRRDREFRDPGTEDQPTVTDVIDSDTAQPDAGLVETPEARRRDESGQRDNTRRDTPHRDGPRRDAPHRDRDAPREGNRESQPREGQNRDSQNRDSQNRERRDRDYRRDRDESRRDQPEEAKPAAAPAVAAPELPAFITGTVEPAPAPAPKPKAEPKPRAPRKPRSDAAPDAAKVDLTKSK